MASALCLLVLLAAAQTVTGRVHTFKPVAGDSAPRFAGRGLRAAAPSVPAGLGDVIEGQFIVTLAPDAGEPADVAGQLSAHVAKALSQPLRGVAAAAAGAGAGAFELVSTLGGAPASGARGAAAAGAGRGVAAVRGLVVRARPAAVAALRGSSLVSAVFPDRVVASQQIGRGTAALGCVDAAALAAGVSAPASPRLKWAGCYAAATTKLVWVGRPCGDGSQVEYTEMRAVDSTSNAVLSAAGRACVALPEPKRAALTKQRFGACGVAPLHAPSLPTRVCTATGGGSSSSSSSRADTAPVASPAPVEVPSSSPVAVPSPSPSPVEAASPSPAPASSPALPRVPVTAGESVAAGVTRIEAVTPAGAVDGASSGRVVVVGIVDSGVDGTHPDLNLVGGTSFVPSEPAADADGYGHGTHVAGIIGARNNGAGVVGVSPGVPLYSLRVLDASGRGSLSGVLAAVAWAAGPEGAAAGIRVINLSLAAYVDPTSADYPATRDAVCASFTAAAAAGVAVTVAAGNYGSAIDGYLPAACADVAVVTALNADGSAPADFSNYMSADASPADRARVLAAPGTDVLSTVSFARDASGYKRLSGTSMAAPFVAGVVANCHLSGACAPGAPAGAALATVGAAAAERVASGASYGFAGDARASQFGKLYGLLAWAGKF
ncbi:Subtilisin BL [Scenedesmus sp. PABB004]|nr:Subtilisin BL [Scenedesmus sp. PABB004]